MKWEDLDENLKTMYAEANLNEPSERRKLREAFKDIQLGLDHCLFKAKYTGIKVNEAYVMIPRGVEIFTKSWIPENSPLKALIFFCHGYGDTCTFFFEGVARKLASHGYAVFALDYPGFGLSEGLHGYITSFDALVEDVSYHFTKIKENEEYKGIPSFLLGESMGGAVVIKVHLKQPKAWSGAILSAPMCKIAEDVTPAWPIQQFLIGIAKFLPRKKLVPQRDIAEMAFRDKNKLAMCAFNVTSYRDKPRLRTALELLRTTQELENRLSEVSLPLLILHGEADIVTDSSVSKILYEKASSSDKKFCLYKDAWHALLQGEYDDVIFKVFDDIISWLDERCKKDTSSRGTIQKGTGVKTRSK